MTRDCRLLRQAAVLSYLVAMPRKPMSRLKQRSTPLRRRWFRRSNTGAGLRGSRGRGGVTAGRASPQWCTRCRVRSGRRGSRVSRRPRPAGTAACGHPWTGRASPVPGGAPATSWTSCWSRPGRWSRSPWTSPAAPSAGGAVRYRRWWQQRGREDHPDAGRLLITADCGGSNDPRRWTWKKHLAAFTLEKGLEVTVCHLPPRDIEVEQDRTPDVLPPHRRLARQAPDQLPGRHRDHRRHDHSHGAQNRSRTRHRPT